MRTRRIITKIAWIAFKPQIDTFSKKTDHKR